MAHDKASATNEHLKQNASSDTEDAVRIQKRMTEMRDFHAKAAKKDSALVKSHRAK